MSEKKKDMELSDYITKYRKEIDKKASELKLTDIINLIDIFLATYRRLKLSNKSNENHNILLKDDLNKLRYIFIFDINNNRIRLFNYDTKNSYKNYYWQIDHILPVKFFDLVEERYPNHNFLKLKDNIDNLQALNSDANNKKKAKIYKNQIDYIRNNIIKNDSKILKLFNEYISDEDNVM
jgi:chorismate mutase